MDIRARPLPKSYNDKARHVDRVYCRTEEGQIGPVQQRLQEFGDLGCFVVGQFGEGSTDLHKFLTTCAKQKARKMANMYGRPSSEFEESQFLQQLRRRLSVCGIRAQANCLLSRLGHMGPGVKEASERRKLARSREEIIRRDLISHWESSVR